MTPMLMRSLAPITRPPLILLPVLAAIADVAAVSVRPVALMDFRKPRRSRDSFVDMRTPYSDGRTLTVDAGRASKRSRITYKALFASLCKRDASLIRDFGLNGMMRVNT